MDQNSTGRSQGNRWFDFALLRRLLENDIGYASRSPSLNAMFRKRQIPKLVDVTLRRGSEDGPQRYTTRQKSVLR